MGPGRRGQGVILPPAACSYVPKPHGDGARHMSRKSSCACVCVQLDVSCGVEARKPCCVQRLPPLVADCQGFT